MPLSIGTYVFIFTQGYEVAEELVTAAVAVSTVLGLVTISLVIGGGMGFSRWKELCFLRALTIETLRRTLHDRIE